MKKLGFLMLAGLSFLCGQLHAQNTEKQLSIELQTPGARPTVTLNYQAKTLEDSITVMDGPFSIDFPLQTVENNGISAEVSYTLKGNFKDGWFDGPMVIRQSYYGGAKNEWGDLTPNLQTSYYLTGSFKEGVPEGQWDLCSDLGQFQGIFKDGYLIGKYAYFNGVTEDNCTGNFNEKHQPEGQCSKMDGFMTFDIHNGVVIQSNKTMYGHTYDAETTAYANQLSENNITLAELEANGIYIEREQVSEAAQDFREMLRSELLLPWKALPGLKDDPRFSDDSIHTAMYLVKMMSLKENGLDTLKNFILANSSNLHPAQAQDLYPGRYFFTISKTDFAPYRDFVKNETGSQSDYLQIFLTAEESALLEKEMIAKRMEENAASVDSLAAKSMRVLKALTDQADTAATDSTTAGPGSFDRALYEAKIAEIIGNEKDMLEDSLTTANLPTDQLTAILQQYGPISAYELTGLEAIPMSQVFSKDLRLISNDPAGYGYNEYATKLKFNGIQGSSSLNLQESFLETETTLVPNDWQKVWELQDSIQANDNSIRQLLSNPELAHLLGEPELGATAFPAPVDSAAQSIAEHQGVVTRQNFQIKYLNKCAELIEGDARIRREMENLQDISIPYLEWYNGLEMEFIPNEGSAKKLIAVRELMIDCLDYISTYKKLITVPDLQLRERISKIPGIRKPYETWYTTQDLKWKAETGNSERLIPVNEVITNCLTYADYYLSRIMTTDKEIAIKADTLLHINIPYRTWIDSQDLSWTPEPDRIKKLESTYAIQASCLKFIGQYLDITAADRKVMELTHKNKRSGKFYGNWFVTFDFTWTPDIARNAELDEIRNCQQIFLTAAEQGTLKDLDKFIRKSKSKTMDDLKAALAAAQSAATDKAATDDAASDDAEEAEENDDDKDAEDDSKANED